MTLKNLLNDWNLATGDAKYGVQRVFHDTFVLAAEGKTTLIYGADYRDGFPCLVNTVGSMLVSGGGTGIPSQHFGEIVSLFDRINREFESSGVNDRPGYVSPLAAEILVKHFGTLKDEPPVELAAFRNPQGGYMEPEDTLMAEAMVSLMTDEEFNSELTIEPESDSFDGIKAVKPASHEVASEPPC